MKYAILFGRYHPRNLNSITYEYSLVESVKYIERLYREYERDYRRFYPDPQWYIIKDNKVHMRMRPKRSH